MDLTFKERIKATFVAYVILTIIGVGGHWYFKYPLKYAIYPAAIHFSAAIAVSSAVGTLVYGPLLLKKAGKAFIKSLNEPSIEETLRQIQKEDPEEQSAKMIEDAVDDMERRLSIAFYKLLGTDLHFKDVKLQRFYVQELSKYGLHSFPAENSYAIGKDAVATDYNAIAIDRDAYVVPSLDRGLGNLPMTLEEKKEMMVQRRGSWEPTHVYEVKNYHERTRRETFKTLQNIVSEEYNLIAVAHDASNYSEKMVQYVIHRRGKYYDVLIHSKQTKLVFHWEYDE